MARKFNVEVIMNEDGNVTITTINEGDFNLMEKYGIIELCKSAITNEHNNRIAEQPKKSRKKLHHP